MSMWLEGAASVFTLQNIFLIVVGVAIGIVFGAIPGLSANMAVTLCLPLSFGLKPIPGMLLLVALYLGGISGGLISAILIKIPGTPASIATCFDGGPMADQGRAGEAMGYGVLCSFLGGLFSILVLMFIAPLLAQVALKFGPFEYAAVGIFSLTLVSGLVGKSIVKGLIGAFLGILMASVGSAPIDNAPRFILGIEALGGGFNIIAVMIGIFAVIEVVSAAEKGALPPEEQIPISYELKGLGVKLKDLWHYKWQMLRAAIIGTGIGFLPGLGGSTANVLAYAVAKNQSKYPEKFGTGIPDGVVASETSNNATIGGALIPLLTLGIPGDVTTAILLGALTIHGISAGPLLFKTDGNLVYSIFIGLIVANIAMVVLMYGGLRFFVKLLRIPKHLLLPVVMVLCLVGAFAINNLMFDVWCVLFFGIVGIFLKKANIPFAPIVMGFILGPIIELYLRRASMLSEGSMLPLVTRPIPAVFIIIAVVFLLLTFFKEARVRIQRAKTAKQS